jgi:hypothetical protein
MADWPMTASMQWLCQNEIMAGYRIVRPGEVDWLSLDDWHPMTIVSMNAERVRLVALQAQHPGHGALKRLIAEIIANGSQPVIVEPFEDLEETLRRWGWKQRRIGTAQHRQTVWYPDEQHPSQSTVDGGTG